MINALLLLLVPFLVGLWIARRLAAQTRQRPPVKRWNRFEETDPSFVHRLELRQKPPKPEPAPRETLQPNAHWLKMRDKQRRSTKRVKQNKPTKPSHPH